MNLPANITSAPRPKALPVKPDLIPDELKVHIRWVVWKYTNVKGKWTKPPYIAKCPTVKASTKNPNTWIDFQTAVDTYETNPDIDGIGYVASPDDGLVWFDLDKCFTGEGKPNPAAEAIINTVASYTEISPSGQGIRIIARGSLPGKEINNRKLGYELYDGNGGRYLTLTGQVITE